MTITRIQYDRETGFIFRDGDDKLKFDMGTCMEALCKQIISDQILGALFRHAINSGECVYVDQFVKKHKP